METEEMLMDVKAYDALKARLERGEDDLIPLAITERRSAGESPVKVWREHRVMTQEKLAKASGISRSDDRRYRGWTQEGRGRTLKKLTGALK
jgi:hypothetical protein